AETVVAPESGRMRVRLEAPYERLAAEQLADLAHQIVGPRGSFPAERRDERLVRAEEVVALGRGRPVGARPRPASGNARGRTWSQSMRIPSNIARLLTRWRRAAS